MKSYKLITKATSQLDVGEVVKWINIKGPLDPSHRKHKFNLEIKDTEIELTDSDPQAPRSFFFNVYTYTNTIKKDLDYFNAWSERIKDNLNYDKHLHYKLPENETMFNMLSIFETGVSLYSTIGYYLQVYWSLMDENLQCRLGEFVGFGESDKRHVLWEIK